MADGSNPEKPDEEAREEEEDRDVSFEELGLDPRLTRALAKKGVAKATPIQREAIPLILVISSALAPSLSG